MVSQMGVGMNNHPRFITISGMIGAGKTTYAKKLADKLGYKFITESVDDNPFLADFYKEPKKYAYLMQEYFKSVRFHSHLETVRAIRDNTVKGVIIDRTIYEDLIFCSINHQLGNIETRCFNSYVLNFKDLISIVDPPNLMIFLDVPLNTCMERIDTRARDSEKPIMGKKTDPYLEKLYSGYCEWVAEYRSKPNFFSFNWSQNLTEPNLSEQIISTYSEAIWSEHARA